MILTIAARELRSLFLSPLAWTILAVLQAILAWRFLWLVEGFLQVQPRLISLEGAPGLTEIVVSNLFVWAAVLMLLVMPLLTMRLVSEERRSGTLALLLSAPVSMTEIILGKYLGIMGFLLCILGLVALMPLSLLPGSSLDFGLVASGLLGLLLVTASFAAAGLFLSTMTEQPTVAAISTFGLLLLLWILNQASNTAAGEGKDAILAYLSTLGHYEALLKGVFDTQDVLYYLLFIVSFLVMSIRRLDAERLQN